MNIEILKNSMLGKSACIIAHGQSILNLQHKDLSGIDCVFVLNKAILATRILKVNIPVFYMTKDAGKPDNKCKPTCLECDTNCSKIKPLFPEILLVHEHESVKCFPNYQPRFIFNNSDYGLYWMRASVCSATHIINMMGFTDIKYFCFDEMVNGNTKTVNDGRTIDNEKYAIRGHLQIKNELDECLINCNFEHVEWIIPC